MTPASNSSLFILTEQPSIGNHFVAQLRNIEVQRDRMRFRRNMERIGELLAYEISKALPFVSAQITTPLGTAHTQQLQHQPVLTTILRAGLPLFQGFLNVFDEAESAFIGAYRGPHQEDHSFDIEMKYLTSPSIEGKTLILIDPMLATGKSIIRSYETLLKHGQPAQVHIATAIASRAGTQYVLDNLPGCKIWTGAVDEELNHKFYIVPGLGDAGDLAFGEKR